MRSPHLLFFTCLIVISLPSCFVPRTIVQVNADPEETMDWNYGHQVVTVQADSMEAKIFFDEFTKTDLIFDVEITNWRSEPVLVSPEDFYLETVAGGNLHAFDPEKQIFESQVESSRDDAARKNAAVAIGVATVAAVVAVAATADDDDDDYIYDGYDGDLIIVAANVAPPPPLTNFPPDLVFWEDYSLRKTTLQPKFRMNGKVVFPRKDNLSAYTFVIPVGDTGLRAKFSQRVIQP